MKKIFISCNLIFVSCFNPVGSFATESSATSTTENNTTSITDNNPTTFNNSSTLTSISSSSSTSTDALTTSVITSSTSTGNAVTSIDNTSFVTTNDTSTTENLKFDMMNHPDFPTSICGNCRLEPGEDCDSCTFGPDSIPKLDKLGCSDSCTFTNVEFFDMGIFCALGWNFCGAAGCDSCEADLACNVFWKRRAILEGFNPNTLSIKAKSYIMEFPVQPISGVVLSLEKDNDTAYFLPYRTGMELYPGPIHLNEYSSMFQMSAIHQITCEILD